MEKPVVLELKNITKSFDGNDVLRGVNLTVHEGEFVTLLGSSPSSVVVLGKFRRFSITLFGHSLL